LIAIAKINNRDISISRNRVLQQQEDVLVSQKGLTPTLSFNGALGVKNGYQPDIQQNRFNYLVGAGISIPIYNGNRLRTQMKISQSSLQSAKFAATGTEITVRRDIQQALADIQASSDRLRNIESQITQSKRAMELASSRLKNGTITYLEWLNAQTNLQQAYQSKLRYEYELILAKVEMARLLGIKYW
jgi:outer membrane protein